MRFILKDYRTIIYTMSTKTTKRWGHDIISNISETGGAMNQVLSNLKQNELAFHTNTQKMAEDGQLQHLLNY